MTNRQPVTEAGREPNPEAVRRIVAHLWGEDFVNLRAAVESFANGWTVVTKAEAQASQLSEPRTAERCDRIVNNGFGEPAGARKQPPAAARVGMPGWVLLNVFGDLVCDAFGEIPYLVGSAIRKKTWRDVDVRLILDDDLYAAAFPLHPGLVNPHPAPVGTSWSAVSMAFSALGKQITGLPIDFQVQSQTQANREPGAAARVPIGMRLSR